nr:hypothetical protein [Tanacetum cinerariifolium]
MEIDLESRLMGEALILDRSRDPDFGSFIELDDLHELLELRRDQPTIKEGEVIDTPIVEMTKARNYDDGINDYPSFCDYDRKIYINGRYNLRNFYVVSDFAVMENMDAYRDVKMGYIILGNKF